MSVLLPAFIPPDNVLLCDSLARIRKQLDTSVLNAMVGHAVSMEYTEALCLVFLNCVAQVQQCCHAHAASIFARNGGVAMDVRLAAANVVRLWLRVCLNREMIGPQLFRDVHTAINQNIYTLVDWASGAIIGPNSSSIKHQLLCSVLAATNKDAALISNSNKRRRSNHEGLPSQLLQQPQQQQAPPITSASGGGFVSPSSMHIVIPNRQAQVIMPIQNTTSGWTPIDNTPTSSPHNMMALENHHHHHSLPQYQQHQAGAFLGDFPTDPRNHLYASNNISNNGHSLVNNHINNMMMAPPPAATDNNYNLNNNNTLLPPLRRPPPQPSATTTRDDYDGPPKTILAIPRVASPSSDVTP